MEGFILIFLEDDHVHVSFNGELVDVHGDEHFELGGRHFSFINGMLVEYFDEPLITSMDDMTRVVSSNIQIM